MLQKHLRLLQNSTFPASKYTKEIKMSLPSLLWELRCSTLCRARELWVIHKFAYSSCNRLCLASHGLKLLCHETKISASSAVSFQHNWLSGLLYSNHVTKLTTVHSFVLDKSKTATNKATSAFKARKHKDYADLCYQDKAKTGQKLKIVNISFYFTCSY